MDNYIKPLSPYTEGLHLKGKIQHIQNVAALIFVSGRISEITEEIPPVYACDSGSYLVLQTSFVTSSQFKAHNGLEAYN